jgi:hypothetical protein
VGGKSCENEAYSKTKKQAVPGDGAACVGEVLRGGG